MNLPFGAQAETETAHRSVGIYLSKPRSTIKRIALPAVMTYAMATASTAIPFGVLEREGVRYVTPSPSRTGGSHLEPSAHESLGDAAETDGLGLAVRALREASGLTWDQLAKLFGVSRRAVHHWSNGSRMTAHHAEVLGTLARQITDLGETPDVRRTKLLMPRHGGLSLFDQLRSAEGATRAPLPGSRLSVTDLLGASGDDLEE